MAETGFGYLIAGMGLGMFDLGIIQVIAPGAEKKSWTVALALGAVVLGTWLSG